MLRSMGELVEGVMADLMMPCPSPTDRDALLPIVKMAGRSIGQRIGLEFVGVAEGIGREHGIFMLSFRPAVPLLHNGSEGVIYYSVPSNVESLAEFEAGLKYEGCCTGQRAY